MTYPSTLPCPLIDSYSHKIMLTNQFLGEQFYVPKPLIDLKILSESSIQLEEFFIFYIEWLDNGINEFQWQIPFEGIDDYEWTVKIVSEVSVKAITSEISELTLTLEVQDDIDSILSMY